ncbi:MAG: phosphoglucosamine mutase [Candidatus Bathyarchaeia archaeon]
MSEKKRRLFGTNGIRGKLNVDMTADLALHIGLALGTYFEGGPIALGTDARMGGPMLKQAVASGLTATGCAVIDVGLAPTPAVEFLVKHYACRGGVVITASHNPPEFNGIKVIDGDGVEFPPEKEIEVEEIFFKQSFKLAPWQRVDTVSQRTDWLDDYLRNLKSHLKVDLIKQKKFKVLVDPANSVGSLVTPRLLQELGCKVRTVNGHIDGNFPGRAPEPTSETLRETAEVCKSTKTDLGVAHDGDADRSIFIDEKGEVILGDQSLAIIAKGFLQRNPGAAVVTPISSSSIVGEVVGNCGGKLVLTPVGSIHISRKMMQIKAKLGGEENGGVFYGPHQPVRDGAMSAALILEIMAETGKSLSQLVAELPKYYMHKDKIHYPTHLKEKLLHRLPEISQGTRVETLDGVKIWHEDGGWALIRPSGTEPIYRIFTEGKSPSAAQALAEKYKRRLMGIIQEEESR